MAQSVLHFKPVWIGIQIKYYNNFMVNFSDLGSSYGLKFNIGTTGTFGAYTANIHSHIVMQIYKIYGENVLTDDRQTFFVKIIIEIQV